MIDDTLDLPLEKLVLTPEGCEIFDTLCLRLDVNQKYVDLLPQWRDVAHILQLDDLATKWVEVCVRPKEGLTRAMLEIYMRLYWSLNVLISWKIPNQRLMFTSKRKRLVIWWQCPILLIAKTFFQLLKLWL